MKRITNIRTLAALLIASAAIVSCSVKEDIFEEETTIKEEQAKVYTLSVNATKGGDDEATKALSLDGKTLNATWATSENIYVKKGDTWATGSLQPDADAATATLKGSLSGITIAASDVLTLQFPKSGEISYDGQGGTLEDIAANFDYATATVTVESVSATGNIIPTEATTTFQNQQSIVKFTLIDKADGSTPLNATKLIVSDGTNSYTVTPASATSEIYVAIPGIASQTVTLTATVGSDTYTYERANVTFTNGKYYEIAVKMAAVHARPLDGATAEDKGKVIGADGKIYDTKADAEAAGTTAVAMIAYVGNGEGLALALTDEGGMTWSTAKSTCEGKTAVSGAAWMLPSQEQWKAMFKANGGNEAKCDGLNAALATAGDELTKTASYWSSTPYDGNRAWLVRLVDAIWSYDYMDYSFRVRACLSFTATRVLAEATAEDKGKVVCAAGHLHTAKTAVPAGCTAVGILGKVTETGHGLILALQDATAQTWNTINGWTTVTAYAGTTLKQLPAGALGSLTSYTTLGSTAVSNWCVAQKSDYKAIFVNLGSTTGDSEGKTYDGNVNAYITTGVGGTAISGSYWSATEGDYTIAWYFASIYWYYSNKTYSSSVRPVLGF